VSEDVEIDECSACGGIWLDKGELEKIVAREQQENWRMYDRGRDNYDPTPVDQRSKGALESLLKGN
jgi:Zn-finger nucleic acid-binding protein